MSATHFATDAEASVIGACLLSAEAVETSVRLLVASDFGSPGHRAAYEAIRALHGRGAGIDVSTVAEELRRQGAIWPEAVVDLTAAQAECPSTRNVGTYAAIVTEHSARRSLHALGAEMVQVAGDDTKDPAEMVEVLRSRLDSIDSPVLASNPGDVDVDYLLEEPEDAHSAPVVPGLLAEDERAVIVAAEGIGKSEWLRQIVTCAAWGIHPATFDQIEPVPSLLVDLENPRALVRERLRILTCLAAEQSTGHRAAATLWLRPGGIDLRRRSDRLALEDVLRRRRPRLVSIGPVYKAYGRKANETDEQVAAEVQSILDDLRTRFGFALILEHHAPQAAAGTARDLRPFGSSLWLRWPEYGLSLRPDREHPNVLVVGRWRGDRRRDATWPDELRRGDVWPWDGYWQRGMP